MMTETTNLGNGFGSGGYYANFDVDAMGRSVKRIQRAVQKHDIGTDVSSMDAHRLTMGEHYFQTPGGEIVHVCARSPYDGGEGKVRVTFPERDALDEDGEPTLHSYKTNVESLIARMEADGGWTLIQKFEKVDTPQCPRCGRFLTVGEDGYGFPFAQCPCGCDIGTDELEEQGAVIEVF